MFSPGDDRRRSRGFAEQRANLLCRDCLLGEFSVRARALRPLDEYSKDTRRSRVLVPPTHADEAKLEDAGYDLGADVMASWADRSNPGNSCFRGRRKPGAYSRRGNPVGLGSQPEGDIGFTSGRGADVPALSDFCCLEGILAKDDE